MDSRSRFLGCLLGGAVGDALGASVEFMNFEQIRKSHGESGIRDFAPAYGKAGAITDDTQMTLFTAEGIIRALVHASIKGYCDPFETMRRSYLRWFITQRELPPIEFRPDGWLITQKELFRRRAPGKSVMAALQEGGFHPNDPPGNDSKGCGGVMRVAPVGLLMEHPFEFGSKTAAITHGHPLGQAPAGCLSVLIRAIVEGANLEEAINFARESAHMFPSQVELIDQAISLSQSDALAWKAIHSIGGGWTAPDALAIAIFACLRGKTLEEAVVIAVNHDGDSDSTGSIAGQIMGTLQGSEAIPDRWIQTLELKGVIEQVALDLHTWHESPPTAEQIAVDWWVRYPGS
jgi:ADP-ribosylglycohydrolase